MAKDLNMSLIIRAGLLFGVLTEKEIALGPLSDYALCYNIMPPLEYNIHSELYFLS